MSSATLAGAGVRASTAGGSFSTSPVAVLTQAPVWSSTSTAEYPRACSSSPTVDLPLPGTPVTQTSTIRAYGRTASIAERLTCDGVADVPDEQPQERPSEQHEGKPEASRRNERTARRSLTSSSQEHAHGYSQTDDESPETEPT